MQLNPFNPGLGQGFQFPKGVIKNYQLITNCERKTLKYGT
jgi:hypothetical protein